MNQNIKSKIELLSLIDVSEPVCYIERSDSKISSTTPFALSQDINSMLLRFEWIARSSSTPLEEIKLIAIVN